MARPRRACSGPTVGMLFSAWHAVTHAPHPVQRSRSTAIPHLCGIYLTLKCSTTEDTDQNGGHRAFRNGNRVLPSFCRVDRGDAFLIARVHADARASRPRT